MGVTIPPADIYGYLDDSDAPGTILEDEAQGMQKDMDKSKIYKAGYKRGAGVPRTMITSNKRFIKYFRVFCLKVCAAEEMPKVKGLIERFTFIPMTEGIPRKDWADFGSTDEERLRALRNMLLKWRLQTKDWQIPEIELPIKGRLKELWKPIIQIISGLTIETDLRSHIEILQKERLSERINTLEGHLVRVVCELYSPGQPVSFVDLWDCLVKDLGGKLDEKKPNKMDTAEFGEVSKQKIGYRLREVLGGKKTKASGHDNDRVYSFDKEKLERIAKKYGCVLVNRLPSESSMAQPEQVADKRTTQPPLRTYSDEKTNDLIGESSSFNQKEPKLQTQNSNKTLEQPEKVVQVVRSSASYTLEEVVSKAKSVYRLTHDYGIETCVICGVKGKPDWQVTLFDASWGFLCGPCGCKLGESIGKGN